MAGFFSSIGKFLFGSPATRENVSNLRPEQEGLYNQAVNAGLGRGAGGAFGESADYYRNLLSDDSADYNAFAAPALRQYNQDIVPGISEQFAGMGAGGLSSSGFRNAQVQGATDLSERIGALRANLRQRGAEGLANIGQIGLQPYSQNMETEAATPGFLPSIAGGIGGAAAGPIGTAIGTGIGNMASNWFGGKGNKIAPGTPPNLKGPASPNIGSPTNPRPWDNGMQAPNFMQNQGVRGY
jgi:hypothetical protein